MTLRSASKLIGLRKQAKLQPESVTQAKLSAWVCFGECKVARPAS